MCLPKILFFVLMAVMCQHIGSLVLGIYASPGHTALHGHIYYILRVVHFKTYRKWFTGGRASSHVLPKTLFFPKKMMCPKLGSLRS